MKNILVSEVYTLSETACLSLPEDTPLEEVVRQFANQPVVRAIFLTDSKERFTGMIRRLDLLKWLHLQLYGRTGGQRAFTGEIMRLTFAQKARDLARGGSTSMGVRPSDTLQHGMDLMLQYGEGVLPVLDSDGRILGDLRVTDILRKMIELGG